ncbi:MAG: GntR family transcriptional regulator [Bacteroidales bacterium]|nr:GntR family transcriptional regulator [Bacteroidales bacterium]
MLTVSANRYGREFSCKGDKIPSLNELCKKHGLSQDTVLMAYNELKSRGIITTSIGKGYFIANTQVNFDHKVFYCSISLLPIRKLYMRLLKRH